MNKASMTHFTLCSVPPIRASFSDAHDMGATLQKYTFSFIRAWDFCSFSRLGAILFLPPCRLDGGNESSLVRDDRIQWQEAVLQAKCQTEGAFLLDYLRATRKWLANTGKFVHLYPVESEWVRNRVDFTDVKSGEKWRVVGRKTTR